MPAESHKHSLQFPNGFVFSNGLIFSYKLVQSACSMSGMYCETASLFKLARWLQIRKIFCSIQLKRYISRDFQIRILKFIRGFQTVKFNFSAQFKYLFGCDAKVLQMTAMVLFKLLR